MLHTKRIITLSAFVSLAVCLLFSAGTVAAEVKIGVMNVEKVLASSAAGNEAKGKIEAKMKELQGKLKAEDEKLRAMQKDIEIKSSAWSEETKQEKVRELQKKGRELQSKREDAEFELKNLREKELSPILKTLDKVIDSYGAANSFTAILDAKNHVIYFDEAIDISDKLIVELDAAMGQ